MGLRVGQLSGRVSEGFGGVLGLLSIPGLAFQRGKRREPQTNFAELTWLSGPEARRAAHGARAPLRGSRGSIGPPSLARSLFFFVCVCFFGYGIGGLVLWGYLVLPFVPLSLVSDVG